MTTPEKDEPTTLTVLELHTKLGEAMVQMPERADWRVMVPFNRGGPSLGGRTATPVKDALLGFDHDRGKLFIEPQQRLGISDDQLVELGKHARHQANLIFHLNELARKADPAEPAGDLAKRIQAFIETHPGGFKPRQPR